MVSAVCLAKQAELHNRRNKSRSQAGNTGPTSLSCDLGRDRTRHSGLGAEILDSGWLNDKGTCLGSCISLIIKQALGSKVKQPGKITALLLEIHYLPNYLHWFQQKGEQYSSTS